MKVLITGGTGLIGSALTCELRAAGHTVHWLTTRKGQLTAEQGLQSFYWNPAEGKIDTACFDGVEVIVHLAGASIAKRWTVAYKQELLESRVLSANLLFSALKKYPGHQVNHYISASGVALYPDSPTAEYTETSTEVDTGFLGTLVTRWEESADQFQALGLAVTKVRTGVVYAAKGGAFEPIVKPIKMGVGSDFGSGKQRQSWIHLTDIVRLYAWLIAEKHTGVFNGVAPDAPTQHDQTRSIAKALGKPVFLPAVPRFVMKWVLGAMHELLFNDKNVKPQRALAMGFQFQFPDLKSALADLFH
ncbi:MAG: hypothetical protein RLZZ500_227 [Bacteroidota bacterium]|jgi:uncharacterized protein (TIGR01777 family)